MKAMIMAALLMSGAAQATTLYDNLGAHQDDFDSIAEMAPIADSFSTSGTPFVFKDLKLLLRYGITLPGDDGNPPGVPAINDVFLLADNATFPGAVLAHLGSFFDTDLPLTFQPIDFTFAPIVLNPDTRYWIETTAKIGSHAEWSFSLDISGPGVANEFWITRETPTAAPNVLGPYQMRISDEIPEPITVLLLLGALAGMRTIRRT
jgi:hypothetical protein